MRALLVEDSETDARLIAHELRQALEGVQTRRVDTAEGLGRALGEESWDVILCDWSLPGLDALQVIELLKQKELDIPLIIVSGTVGEEAAVLAMRAGARDYVLKDKLARLPPAVEREIGEARARAERRRSQEALRISEARFARLAESGIVGVAIADLTGGIEEANDTYLRICGYTREDLLAGRMSWAQMTPPEFKPLTDKAVELLRTEGAAAPWEMEQIRRDGTRIPIMVAVALLDYPHCLAIVTDLTERRRAEERLRRTEEQLRHVQKMEAIGILAGGVAHDFNNILSIILGYCAMILDDLSADHALRADLEEIKRAGERGASLTQRLLAFSRQQVVEAQVLNLNGVITNVDAMLRRLVREDVTLLTRLEPQLGSCKADPGHIEQVLMNLAVNSVDAMPEGGTLVLETANVDLDDQYVATHIGVKPGRYVRLAVSDTGVGMSKSIQARVFEPFFTTKEKGKGTGLGLATVFGIVQQAGGSIQLYSEQGRGTTFKIYLPRIDPSPEGSAVRGDAVQFARGVETILLVEDEDQLRKVAAGILRRSGFRVLEGASGSDALSIIEKNTYSIELLMTDVVMPRMNGKELAERIRAQRPDIKILFTSGYTDGILEGQLPTGAAFLQKPFSPGALTTKIRELLDGTGVATQRPPGDVADPQR
jgi:PAS domain S-box-containing protein